MIRTTGSMLATLGLLASLSGCSDSGSSSPAVAGGGAASGLSLEATAGTNPAESATSVALALSVPRASDTDRDISLTLEHGDTDDSDVQLAAATVTLPANTLQVATAVLITDDDLPESPEGFTVRAALVDDASISDSLAMTVVDDDTLPSLAPHPLEWDRVGVFSAAADCAQCHRASAEGDSPAVMRAPNPVTASQPSPQGEDISQMQGWHSSVMSNAFTDPYFRANMVHEAETFPALAGFIEDKCLTCHSPMARTYAHQSGLGLSPDDCPLPDGCYRMDSAVADAHAREGVSCTLCHQISDAVIGGGIDSGQYEIADTDSPVIFGPFQSPVTAPMENQLGYEPRYSMHVHSSELCASCHNLFTPTIDVATDQPNGDNFPEQTPYTEWLNSDYVSGAPGEMHCQDCHMGRMDNNFLTRIAVKGNGDVNTNWPERSPFFSHEMIGGNAWLLDTLEQFRTELGLAEVTEVGELAAKAQLTRDFLSGAASLAVDNLAYSGADLDFDITITNHAGHKLPTSFPSRRVWLAVRVRDANDALVFESGFPDARQRLALDTAFTSHDCLAAKKPPGFDSSACYQGHVDTVTDASDVPIYEVVLQATDDSITHVLLYAADRLKDNRIPPAGFDSGTAPDEILPVGIGADADFNAGNAGTDTVHYRLTPGAGFVEPLTVEAVLYYQTIRPTFVDSLHGEHTWVDQFRSVAAMAPPVAETITSVTVSTP